MTRIAVLGADGFIGSHVVRMAVGHGLEVDAITIKDPWRLSRTASARIRQIAVPGGRWWSPTPRSGYRRSLSTADALILLVYTPPNETADRLLHERTVNVEGVRQIGEIASAAGIKVVFASSADVYGPWHPHPVRESQPLNPPSPYGIAKAEAERLLEPDGIVLRIATVYGPGENGPRAVPSFIRAILSGEAPVVHGDGTDVRDYIYVEDVAEAVVRAASHDCPPGAYNVGAGIGRSTNEVLEAVARRLGWRNGVRQLRSSRKPSRLILDVTKAKQALRFAASTEFGTGIDREIEWLRGHLESG